MDVSLFGLLKALWKHVTSRRRKQCILLLVLTLLSSFAEVVSLGAVIPFIGILTEPEKVLSYTALSGFIESMGITTGEELVLPLTIGFALAAFIAGSLRLLLLWVSIRLGNAIGADLNIEAYSRTLFQEYSVHISRNSSEIISGITQKINIATGVLVSLVTVFTSACLFIAIMGTIITFNPAVAASAIVSFGMGYGVIAWNSRARLERNSHIKAFEQTQVVKALQEGLGAIRDVLLDGTQKIYVNSFSKAILRLRKTNDENTFINQAPRFAMEALGMILIAVFVLFLSRQVDGITSALPLLAMLALGAQRLLPLMQQLYSNWSLVIGSKGPLKDAIELLDQPYPSQKESIEEPLSLGESITFEDVSFSYNKASPRILKEINLTVLKGARVGIIGKTGGGKSTALDLLMGLLLPSQGGIFVDGILLSPDKLNAWQRSIAHVPQNIFLADATVKENIAFGVPLTDIKFELVREAAKQAKVSKFIESQDEQYETIVGERGVRLSGGQRQRIGIARALYKKASILIFDEATSALDNETEQEVMKTIEALGEELTLFIIAHRLTTLKNCSHIIELEDGKISRQGTYQEIIKQDIMDS